VLTFDQIAARFKVTTYGQGANAFYGVECADRQYYNRDISVQLNTEGGLGLELAEIFLNPGGASGLVLVEAVRTGSNADKCGLIEPGDALISIFSNGENISSLEGLGFDRTVAVLQKYSGNITLKVRKMTPRKTIQVKVVGPQGEDAGSFQVVAGYETNLRSALLSSNLRV
jgi:hypothetical protein